MSRNNIGQAVALVPVSQPQVYAMLLVGPSLS